MCVGVDEQWLTSPRLPHSTSAYKKSCHQCTSLRLALSLLYNPLKFPCSRSTLERCALARTAPSLYDLGHASECARCFSWTRTQLGTSSTSGAHIITNHLRLCFIDICSLYEPRNATHIKALAEKCIVAGYRLRTDLSTTTARL